MTVIRFLTQHLLYTWVLASCVTVILWAVWLAFFGESDEQREVRRNREAKARTDAKMRAIRDEWIRRKQAEAAAQIEARANRAMEAAASDIIGKLDTTPNVITADTPQRAREAEGAEDYTAASDGRHVA